MYTWGEQHVHVVQWQLLAARSLVSVRRGSIAWKWLLHPELLLDRLLGTYTSIFLHNIIAINVNISLRLFFVWTFSAFLFAFEGFWFFLAVLALTFAGFVGFWFLLFCCLLAFGVFWLLLLLGLVGLCWRCAACSDWGRGSKESRTEVCSNATYFSPIFASTDLCLHCGGGSVNVVSLIQPCVERWEIQASKQQNVANTRNLTFTDVHSWTRKSYS